MSIDCRYTLVVSSHRTMSFHAYCQWQAMRMTATPIIASLISKCHWYQHRWSVIMSDNIIIALFIAYWSLALWGRRQIVYLRHVRTHTEQIDNTPHSWRCRYRFRWLLYKMRILINRSFSRQRRGRHYLLIFLPWARHFRLRSGDMPGDFTGRPRFSKSLPARDLTQVTRRRRSILIFYIFRLWDGFKASIA